MQQPAQGRCAQHTDKQGADDAQLSESIYSIVLTAWQDEEAPASIV